MSDLVRVRVGDVEKNVGRTFAEANELDVIDEPTHNPDGTLRGTTRANGRPRTQKTTVAKEAAARKAAVTESAPDEKGSDQ